MTAPFSSESLTYNSSSTLCTILERKEEREINENCNVKLKQ